MSPWRGIGRAFVHQQPTAISEKKMWMHLHPFFAGPASQFTKSCDRHPCTREQCKSCLFTNYFFFPLLFFFWIFHRVNHSFLSAALKSTTSQGEKLGTKPTVKLAATETERANLWWFRVWFSLTNHASNTQQPLEWPLTVPGNQKSPSQWLEAPPSQPCQEERKRKLIQPLQRTKLLWTAICTACQHLQQGRRGI